MEYTLKEIKPLIAKTGAELESKGTSMMILKYGNMRFLTSYNAFVALEIGDKLYVNKNYTLSAYQGKSWKMCTVTTGSHLRKFGNGCKEIILFDFNNLNDLVIKLGSALINKLLHRFEYNGQF